jgi:hypothetical protein
MAMETVSVPVRADSPHDDVPAFSNVKYVYDTKPWESQANNGFKAGRHHHCSYGYHRLREDDLRQSIFRVSFSGRTYARLM